MPIAAFKTDVDVDLAVNGELFRHGVELHGTNTEVYGIHSSKRLRFGGYHGFRRVESVVGIYFRVFEERSLGIVFGLATVGGRDVDAR